MKQLNRARGITLGLALIAAGLAAPSATAAPAAQTPAAPSAAERIKDTARGGVALRANPATGKVGFVRTKNAGGDLLPSALADTRSEAAAKADKYVAGYAAAAFGVRASQLARTNEVAADSTGWTFTYAQRYNGVPVFGGELKAHVDRAGRLTSVNGYAAPGLSLSTTPSVSRAQAAERALALVRQRPAGHEGAAAPADARGLQVRSQDLVVYRTGSTRGIDGDARLAWVLEVWNKKTIRETLVIDAISNKDLNRWSMMAHALERELYEGAHAPANREWAEGEAFPGTLDIDQQNEIAGAGETYWMFRNTFGYNSWDGTGGKMITVNNDPTIDCPNANWNGITTNYCTGVTGDDTVAHEWGHAYTESTSGLIYQWQSGAMNEAYSDIWGETVDMLNDRQNETPAGPREPGKCSTHQPAAYELNVTILAPAEIAGPCSAAPAAFGPELQGTQTVDVIVAQDADADEADDPIANDTETNGCSLPWSNAGAIAGEWAYVDRGGCTFQVKVDNAEASGAVGLVIGNNQAGAPFSPSGVADIPGIFVTQADGTRIKSVAGPVTMEIERVVDPLATDDTYRWLSGEGDPAFGGAIRDLWNPNCFGDPGKVTDEEYHCSSDDAGGVHTNSGVVNRTFAILVDGLPEAGVEPIGLDKAAWLFWYSQFHLLTPTSYFPDLADALETSCTNLTGQDIERVTLGESATGGGPAQAAVIDGGMTEADCDSLAAAIAETELRTDPTATCDWQPLLKPGAPTLDCGAGKVTKTIFDENFEDGLAGWTQDEDMVFADTETFPWRPVTDAHGHAGTAAYSPDPTSGVCDTGGPDNITSRTGLISPAITVPAHTGSPRMSFDHYVATEAKYDGANVKVSVNGGAYTLIDPAAYVFNAPQGTLDPAQGPMGGETAWHGTDGGKLESSWGTSVIDLTKVAAAGASVKFRFDLGRDGCNGVDGWYVDNVKVQVCDVPPVTPPTPPTPKAKSVTVAKVSPTRPRFGRDFTLIGKATVKGVTAPASRIIFKIDGERVGSRKLDDGRAVMTVRRNYGAGKHTLVVIYKGSELVERSKDKLRFWIRPE